MFEPIVELLNGRVVSEPQDVTTADPRQTPRTRHDQEAKRAHAWQEIGLLPVLLHTGRA